MSGENGQELPQGWAKTTLDGIVQPRVDKIDPQARPRAKFIGMQHIEAHTMRLLGTVSADSMKSTANAFRSGDVLYGRLRPYLNKVCRSDFEGLCSGELIVIPESCAMHGKFLGYRLNSGDFVRFSSGLNTGDRPRVDFNQIKVFPIHLPPIREQIRIGDTLDELFFNLDIGVAALERVRDKLKLYRASVLKAAVEGALTAEWRQQNPQTEPAVELLKRILVARRRRWEEDQLRKFEEKGKSPPKNWEAKYKEPVSPSSADLPSLPEGWCWATVDQLTSKLMNGFGKRSQAMGNPCIVLRLADVSNGEIAFNDVRRINCTEDQISKYELKENDLLILRVNGSADLVGRFVRFENAPEPVLFCDHFIRAQCVSKDLATWLRVYADIDRFRRHIDLNKVSSAGQNTVSQGTLLPFAVPLPPTAEQGAIIEIFKDHLFVIKHLETGLETKLKAAQGLRQAILRHAFTGKLVPQDLNDEPASELLKRIATERAKEAAAAKQSVQKGNGASGRRRWSREKKKETAA